MRAARSPAQARFLGLWTAGWLAVLLVAGMVRFGDPAVQWPVLVVPVLWALVALRPRRSPRASWEEEHRTGEDAWADEEHRTGEDGWTGPRSGDGWGDEAREWPPPGERTDTVERPALRRRSDGTGERW